MEKLIHAGYGYAIKICVVSMRKGDILNFWGCACPLWWIKPSYDMEAILRRGEFGSGTRAVIAQANTLGELENQLLREAKEKFPDPLKLPNGSDTREVYPELFRLQT